MKTLNAPSLLSVGSRRFAPSASALVDTLFASGGTADGIYSVRKNGVLFKRPDGTPFAFLVANPGQSRFFVSCGYAPQKGAKPALYYAYALSSADESALGVAGMGYGAESAEADRVWSAVKASANE